MKTLLILLTIIATLAIYSFGAFVPDTQGVEKMIAGLVVLSDIEMSQQTAGLDRWTSAPKSWGNMDGAADCSDVNDCPDGQHFHTLDLTKCVPCENWFDNRWTREKVPHKIMSWCDNFGYEGVRCKYKSSVNTMEWSCDNYLGGCGDHVPGEPYPWYLY